MLKNIAILAFVSLASPALANGYPHTQDDWFVNSGRYLDGQIVSYNQHPTRQHVVDYAGSRRSARMVEYHTSVPIGGTSWSMAGGRMWGREEMVRALGA